MAIIKKSTIPIYMIFLAMGLIDSAGPMVSLAKESFKISNTMASLLPLLAYVMYGLLSVPIGLLQDRKGKKFILNMGLAIALSGLVIPIFSGMYGKMVVDGSSMMQFYKILAAILLLGAGGSILQVAGNPIMRDISDEGHYSKNLSFAQSIITIGSSMGFLLPVIVLHAFGLDWSILFPVFSCLVLFSFVGLNLMSDRPVKRKIQLMLIAGLASLLIGFSLDFLNITPIIKKIATSSFVFASGGWSILALCFSYWLIDVKKLFSKGSKFFIIIGMNCIFIYLFFELGGAGFVGKIFTPFTKALFSWGGDLTVLVMTSLAAWASLWYIYYWLYKNRIFIKI